MAIDTTGDHFQSGGCSFTVIDKSEDETISIWEIKSIDGSPAEPTFDVVLKNFPNASYPLDAYHRFQFRSDQKEVAERLFKSLQNVLPASRPVHGYGYWQSTRSWRMPLHNSFAS